MLIAGEGQEATQAIGGRVLPFDDRVVARGALALAGWTGAPSVGDNSGSAT